MLLPLDPQREEVCCQGYHFSVKECKTQLKMPEGCAGTGNWSGAGKERGDDQELHKGSGGMGKVGGVLAIFFFLV